MSGSYEWYCHATSEKERAFQVQSKSILDAEGQILQESVTGS